MKIEFNGETIEVGDWESTAIEAEPGVAAPRVPHDLGITPGVSFISEVVLEIGDVFTAIESGIKYQVSEQEGLKYWARSL